MGRCLFVTRPINGVDAHFILDENGNERQINFSLDTDRFCNDRCPFNVQEWNGPEVYIGEYYGEYCDIAPGKWGIIDSKGDIVVAPQYVFAIGFYYGDGNHSAVARLKEGKLAWGVIDISGKETIPCQYSELYIPVDGYVVYRSEGSRLWGLMDYDGNVLADPQFEYIEGYDPEHRLITVGEDDETLGVYSLEQKRMIIPAEYDCIDYSESFIDCEIQYTARSRLFDYSGNEIFFQDYDSVYDSKGNLNVWKDGKAGIIDKNGQVIIPPVLRNGLDVNAEYYMKGYMIDRRNRSHFHQKSRGA